MSVHVVVENNSVHKTILLKIRKKNIIEFTWISSSGGETQMDFKVFFYFSIKQFCALFVIVVPNTTECFVIAFMIKACG